MVSITDLYNIDINKKIPAHLIVNQNNEVRWVIIGKEIDKFEEALKKIDELKIEYPQDKLGIMLADIESGEYPPEIIS